MVLCTFCSVLSYALFSLSLLSLQLSTFVAYTWQCMKLPDQPSLSTTTTDSTVVATRLPRMTKTRTGDGGAVDDVTIAAADSTAHGVCC